jgi:hypothetical protein
MSITPNILLAAAVGCGLTMMGTGGAYQQPPALDDALVKAVVAYFAKNGVKLEKADANWWVVTDPKAEGYEVLVAWRTFPRDATEQQMHAELRQINLAFLLNAPARVAMSYPGLRSTDPARKLPPLDQVPVVTKLKKLFEQYRPPEPKK